MSPLQRLTYAMLIGAAGWNTLVGAAPIIADPAVGTLELPAHDNSGNEQLVASGFNKAAGLAFDPLTGDLYISEQQSRNIWRLQFTPSAAPMPASVWLLGFGLGRLLWVRHRRHPDRKPTAVCTKKVVT